MRSAIRMLTLFLAALPGFAQEGADLGKLVEGAALSLDEAIDKGLAEAGDGVAFHAELEWDKGSAVFSIDVAQGTKTCNVVLDGKEGKVVEKEVEDEDHSKAVAACKVTLKAAIAAALQQSPGRAVEARLVTVNEKPRILVKVAAGGAVTLTTIDGVTGEAQAPRPLPGEEPFTDTFRVDAAEWSSTGANPYFILEPGYVLVLGDGEVKLTITVLDETRKVAGVETRVVEEREEKAGALVEVSRNFFAISKRTNDVCYFGEEVDIYEDGKVKSHEGAWLAGEKGARWGLIMPGTPLLGARYCQEIAPGVAMDRAEIVGLGGTFETPAGKFEGCLTTVESSALESGKESKIYAPGVGLVRDGKLRLARHGRDG